MTKTKQAIVLGGGGHAKVVISTLQACGYVVTAVFDDAPPTWGTKIIGVPVVGPLAAVEQASCQSAVIAIGNNATRKKLAGSFGLDWLSLVHPAACVHSSVQLGAGTVVMAGAVIQPDAVLGDHVIANTAATIDHDCAIGDFVHLAPGIHLGGDVRIAEGTFMGLSSSAIPGIRIGSWTTVGAGAVVVRDLPDDVLAFGVPARPRSNSKLKVYVHKQGKELQMKRIYLSPPHMGTEEIEFVKDAFETNWIAPLGPHVDAFESEFADNVGAKYAAALSSGTAALHLALRLIGVQPGDEVLCSTLTFSASANSIVYQGGQPVFIDAERESWNMDPELLRDELKRCAARNKLPSACIVVDLYGQCADYDQIVEACAEYDVPIVEDAAEALGATYNGRKAGTFGKFGVFSFNGNKIITTSGGGMLVSEDEKLTDMARYLATQARDPAPHYQHSVIGFNYRMSNVLAAIGRGQLLHLPERVAARRRNFDYYEKSLGDLPGLNFMPEMSEGLSNRWLTTLTINPQAFGASREAIRLALEAEQIEARPVWKPMHLQPVFAGCRVRGGNVSEDIFEHGLCLPSGSSLTEAELDRVIGIVRGVCRPAQLFTIPRSHFASLSPIDTLSMAPPPEALQQNLKPAVR